MSKEKRTEQIQDALNYLDDELVEDVDKLRGFVDFSQTSSKIDGYIDKENQVSDDKNTKNQKRRNTKYWKKWITLAASVSLFMVGSWLYEAYIKPSEHSLDMTSVLESVGSDKDNSIEESSKEETQKDDLSDTANAEVLKNGVTIPQMKVNLKRADGIEEDMLGFFILNGRSYIQYELHQENESQEADFVGAYVGYVTGTIDEWTESDGYVEGAGTYTGNVYEVKGVSPDFMLCMVWENGWVETFINHNDITLYKGSDLVDGWLNLRDNYDAILLEKIVENQFTYETLELTEEEMVVFDRFLDAFAEGDYVYAEEKMEQPFGGDSDATDMMEFYFKKENGVRLRFRTLGDGYVSFPWIHACVKIDQEIYDEVVEVLLKYNE